MSLDMNEDGIRRIIVFMELDLAMKVAICDRPRIRHRSTLAV